MTKLTFLGTGTSQGVPVISCGCRVCSSPDSRDKRLRTAALVEQDGVVLAQSIDKFTEVLPGSVVNMTVGRYDRRRYTANVTVSVDVPEEGVTVRVTLVDENGQENDMYAATYSEAGPMELRVTLRSETSGVRTWRLYLDGNFKSEATAVLQ